MIRLNGGLSIEVSETRALAKIGELTLLVDALSARVEELDGVLRQQAGMTDPPVSDTP